MTAHDPGLQAQRTSLSWTRTALAVLANGAVLMLHDLADHRAGIGLLSAGVAAAIAFLVFVAGMRRQRVLARHPLPSNITPTAEVHAVTTALFVLIAVSVVSLPR